MVTNHLHYLLQASYKGFEGCKVCTDTACRACWEKALGELFQPLFRISLRTAVKCFGNEMRREEIEDATSEKVEELLLEKRASLLALTGGDAGIEAYVKRCVIRHHLSSRRSAGYVAKKKTVSVHIHPDLIRDQGDEHLELQEKDHEKWIMVGDIVETEFTDEVQKDVWRLHMKGKTSQEIALELQIPLTVVYQKVRNGRKFIRRNYQEQ